MSNIYNCERTKSRIEGHSHYGPCFNGGVYSTFSSKRSELSEIRSCYDDLIKVEKELIDYHYKISNMQREIDNLKRTNEIKINNIREEHSNEERIKSKEYDNEIERLRHKKENYQTETANKLKLLEQDISNLKKEIDLLKSKNDRDIDYKKDILLNEIENDYKLKLLRYENDKKKEIELKKKDMAIRKEEFEANKECEINDMKNKALIAQKLSVIFKNLS